MTALSSILQAAGLFIVTNVDDIIVLSLFYTQGAGLPRTTTKILLGQYLGFGGILLTSVAVALSAGALLPEMATAYFGLLPLLLGLRSAWRAWRDRDDDDDDDVKGLSVLTIAAVTFANGGDNIGVYVPVFLAVGPAVAVVYVVVFLLLVAVLVLAARVVATRAAVARALERWESVLFPLVLIVLGIVILVEGGAFGL